MAPRRPGTGRKKVEIQPIQGKEERQVCFSKRRSGLFNKVTELSTLCGVALAAIAFSPGGKAFSVGHPSVEYVLDRFLPSNSPEAQAAAAVGIGNRNPALEELIRVQGELRAKLDEDKARKDALKKASANARAEGCQAAALVHTEVSQMGEEDLVAFQAALAKMQAATAAHANQLLLEALLVGQTVPGGGGMPHLLEMGLMMPMPPLTGFAAGMETMQQQQMAVAMPPGYAAGLETFPYQRFGPHGFPE